MRRMLSCLLLAVALCGLSTGCRTCCTPWDYAYSAYGGKWPRHDMFRGRVRAAGAAAFLPGMDDAPELIPEEHLTPTPDAPAVAG